MDRRGGEGRRQLEVGGGPCVRLVLPWSGSSPAIEAAGRQNKAGGGAHTERQRQPRLLRRRRQCTSRLSLCASSCPCLLKHWIATRKTIASHQPHFYQERSNGLCQTSQSNMAATDLALLSRESDALSTLHLFCAPCRGNEELWSCDRFSSDLLLSFRGTGMLRGMCGRSCGRAAIALRELHSHTYKELSSSIFQMPFTDPVTSIITFITS